jgi:hypothetical protein
MMIPRILLTVGVLLGLGAAAVHEHEVRRIGAYTLSVDFRAEPAFEDVVNAIDIFINRTTDDKAISVRDGDVVDLRAEVQFREAEDSDADILATARLRDKPAQDFAASNRYNAWFKLTHSDVYAFRITGHIADTGDPQAGPQAVDATFVCGDGTQSPTTRFNCVADPQPFPGTPRDGYRNNQAFRPH